MTHGKYLRYAALLAALAALAGTRAGAQADLPRRIEEGLELADGPFSVLYWRPGHTLERYRRVALLDCYIEFREDWLSDQNQGKLSYNRVDDDDMSRIRDALSAEFREIVTEALHEAYAIVDVAAPDVLVLRPAIVNLDVGAELYGAGSQLPNVTNGVAMTLYLEFFDAATGTLVGRALDRRARPDMNRSAVRRILDRWAGNLRDLLDAGVR